MKISCQSCQAKYTIADEKVVGKIVKIRCKKCGATIVINGNEDATAASAQGGGAGFADYTAGGDEQWTVNVAEGDQRTMSVQEIAHEFKTGVVTDDTYCWKDGMNDWLPLREIETLYSAVTLGPPPALQTSAEGFTPLSLSPAAPGSSPETDTVANVNFGLFGGGSNGGGAENTRTDVSNGSTGALFGSGISPPPAAAASSSNTSNIATGAARRTGGRGAGGADLFGSAAQAGGENDVLTSAATANAGAAATNDASKMTGARNENSVLFSLNALTNEPSKPAGGGGGGGYGIGGSGGAGGRGDTSATGDGSGLIDIRALAQSMGVENGAKSGAKVDDIMNLSGGGAFSAALAAPVLAPPPADYSNDMSSPEGQQKNKTTLIAIIGGALFLGVCILGAAFMFSGGKKDDDIKASPAATETATALTASATPPPAETTAVVAATPPGTQPTAPTTGGGTTHNTGGAKPSTGGGAAKAATGAGASPAPAETPTHAPVAAKPKSLAEAMQSAGGGGAAAKPEAASAGGSMPFDKGAALAALGGVNATACKKPDGPTGPGKVKVTFEPNGSVSKVEFAEGPYAGTPVGGCILGKFRGARIPAFSGPAVTAGKSFAIN